MDTGNRRVPTPVLRGVIGHGVLLAHPLDAPRVRATLENAGYAVADARLGGVASADGNGVVAPLRRGQAAVADALRLPETAGRNLDALVDSLRDLATWWPGQDRVALLLHRAETLVDADLPAWHSLTDILVRAVHELRPEGPGHVDLSVVAFVDGHGVRPLPMDQDLGE